MIPRHPRHLFAFVLTCCLVLAACEKGDTGPEGPQGPPGPTGPAGPAATSGQVIYSDWLDVPFVADTIHNGAVIDTLGFIAEITAAKLTTDIISRGDMKVFLNVETASNPHVVPLPYLDIYSGISISADFFIARIVLYSNANASTVTVDGQKYLQYRYILIPGTEKGRLANKVDWNNYASVKAYLGLKD